MRTTKRFTPGVLERFRRDRRGQGVMGDYIPWHRVSRSDPSSLGRSHLIQGNHRQNELLSDYEWVALMFILMLPNRVDVREQFPLSLESSDHELSHYIAGACDRLYLGTLEVAQALQLKHPVTSEAGTSAPWIMTTDFLVALRNENGGVELLAVAIKPEGEMEKKRKRRLLSIEREYWEMRGVPWLLVTPQLYDKDVALNLRMQMPWMTGEPSTAEDRRLAADVVRSAPGRSLTFVLQKLETLIGSMDRAQRALWQAVFKGEIPMNLRRGWRPHQPIHLLSMDDFMAQNPIALRRSSWI